MGKTFRENGQKLDREKLNIDGLGKIRKKDAWRRIFVPR